MKTNTEKNATENSLDLMLDFAPNECESFLDQIPNF